MKNRFCIVSLGCAKNLVDSEVMVELLKRSGYIHVEDPDQAETLIVNTCGFIEAAKRESVDMILELAEYKREGSCQNLIVTGCLAQRYAKELHTEIPEIDALVGTGDYPGIVNVINSCKAGSTLVAVHMPGQMDALLPKTIPSVSLTPAYTSYVKIADGCNHSCSYCIIPQLRGPLYSRPAESIIEEVIDKTRNGVQEIILVAQDVTQYGLDLGDRFGLEKLLSSLAKIDTLQWLRLLYAYPQGISPALAEIIAGHANVCNYLDIPMQHCSQDILTAMRRPDTKAKMIALVKMLRSIVPDIALRSSFIVGFPGETEEHFAELLEFLEEIRLDRAGFFAYSQEEGTAAAILPNQIPPLIKEERYHRALECQERIAHEVNRAMIGRIIPVLVEDHTESTRFPYTGRSYRDAPEVDGQVYIQGENLSIGSIIQVRVYDADPYDLYGIYTASGE
jgi:ribosomal protein S12 methylthiotransferase